MQILSSACDKCDLAALERVPRKLWMRLLPAMRHYRCTQCGRKQLAPKALVDSRKWLVTTFKEAPARPGMNGTPAP